LLGGSVPVSKAQKAKASECKVEITSPRPGSNVSSPEDAEGKATIVDDGFLWILSHRRGLPDWWPQQKAEITPRTGSWKVTVFYGEDRDRSGTEFEIVAVVVNKTESDKLASWLKKARETDNYRNPPSRPVNIEGCAVNAPIIVVKQ
ncbi:MAG: hypothetical protein WAV47_21700, partial [Blastocatellia bacterium]